MADQVDKEIIGVSSKMDIKKFLRQTERIVKDVGAKAGEVAKALEKDAAYGTKTGMIRIEQLSLETERGRLLSMLGGKAYELIKKKQMAVHKGLDKILEDIDKIDKKIKEKKTALANLKRQRTAGASKSSKAPKK
ncbi:MAG: hypothetical protein JXJ19_06180 [Elusimicrobia bacterium]|nr:hypothetical protein [Elusimicrobiota bacterium]